MKRSFLFLLCFVPITAQASPWFHLDTGLDYRTAEIKSPGRPRVIHAFKINPRRYELKPIKSSSPASVRQMAEKNGALIAVNANFFDSAGKPLGLVVGGGLVLNPFRQVKWWSIFGLDRGRPFIAHSQNYQHHAGIKTAIQAGPRLLIKGTIPKLKADASPRTAIGITKKGEVMLVATQYPVQPTELALLMSGLGCVDALNFDGGSSTQMYAHIGGFELKLPSYLGVPVGLGVFRR